MLAVGGEICIEVSGVESTVMLDSPLTEPNCAVMVATPPESALTAPYGLTLATVDADEDQVAKFVITRVLPSLNLAVARQFTEVVGASRAVTGVTEIEEIVAGLTYRGVEPETPSKVAEMLAVPGASAMATPVFPILATAGLSEFHMVFGPMVMFCVVSSLNKPIAVKGNFVAW